VGFRRRVILYRVAVQTVYAVFGSKRQLLSELLDVTIAGDDEPVALPERSFVAEIRALADPRAEDVDEQQQEDDRYSDERVGVRIHGDKVLASRLG